MKIQNEWSVGDKVHLGFGAKGGAGYKGKIIKIEGDTVHVESEEADKYGKKVWKGPIKHLSNSFENGRMKAEEAIMNRAGVKFENWNRKDMDRKKLLQLIQDGVIEVVQGDARKDRDIKAEMTNNRREIDIHITD
jgi:hypothetical protein